MFSRFWMRLAKLGLVLLISYLIVAYALLITITIRRELKILDPPKAISVFQQEKTSTILEGNVCNVFGDPVPHAVIAVGDSLIQADNRGAFSLNNLQPGRYTLEIFAGDYEKYSKEIHIEEGTNRPSIKYDTGLWPQVFLVDFHIFYKDHDEVLGILGFANGTADPIYISKAVLLNPRKQVILDLLGDLGGFEYYSDLSSKIQLVHTPEKALKWAARLVQNGEFPPIQGDFRPGPYTLEVHYGNLKDHEKGRYSIFTITDHLDLNSNWNPHLQQNP